MRLKSHKVIRQGDTVTVNTSWISKFKKPMYPNVILHNDSAPTPLMSGDVLDVHGFLFGCAAIAWSLGWRPAGFLKAMNTWVSDYKPGA